MKGKSCCHAVDFAWVSIFDLPEEAPKSSAAIGPLCRKPPDEFGKLCGDLSVLLHSRSP